MRLSDLERADEIPAREPADESASEPHSLRAPPSLRHMLRAATSDAHARLHLHSGFAAIQNGTIDLAEYRALLARLYGFHVPFEAAVGIANDRSAWLRDDLAALTMSVETLATQPQCTALARWTALPGGTAPARGTVLTAFDTPARRLGALYVVEGAMLGGRHLARSLDPLLGGTGSAGRRFFLGRGADTHGAWNAFLARLTCSASTPAERSETVAAAVSTFSIFEEWLRGWRNFT